MNVVTIHLSTLQRLHELASQAVEHNEAADIVNPEDETVVGITQLILTNAGRATSN